MCSPSVHGPAPWPPFDRRFWAMTPRPAQAGCVVGPHEPHLHFPQRNVGGSRVRLYCTHNREWIVHPSTKS